MRIIAGAFGGRRLRAPRGRGVRPSGERLREAWFSILGPRLEGATVLDLFAGSGALGLEALSRGAEHADFVERRPSALAALRANITALGVAGRTAVHKRDALQFASALPPKSYDVVFADPPYATDAAHELVTCFRQSPFGGVLGVEHAARESVDGDDTRRYGDAAITFCYAP
jgi:16S rRNA (guanine966-N2)-methyltransferase